MKKIILCVAMAFMFFCGSSAAVLMENGSGGAATAATEENEEAVYEQSMIRSVKHDSTSNWAYSYVATIFQKSSKCDISFRWLASNHLSQEQAADMTKNDALVTFDNTIFDYTSFIQKDSSYLRDCGMFSPIKFINGNTTKILSSSFYSYSTEDVLTLTFKNDNWETTTINIMGEDIEITNPNYQGSIVEASSPAKTLNDMDIDGNGVCDARDASLLLRFYTLASSMGDNERHLTDEDVPYFLEHNTLIGMD